MSYPAASSPERIREVNILEKTACPPPPISIQEGWTQGDRATVPFLPSSPPQFTFLFPHPLPFFADPLPLLFFVSPPPIFSFFSPVME